jgi:hypothetical protein
MNSHQSGMMQWPIVCFSSFLICVSLYFIEIKMIDMNNNSKIRKFFCAAMLTLVPAATYFFGELVVADRAVKNMLDKDAAEYMFLLSFASGGWGFSLLYFLFVWNIRGRAGARKKLS